MKRLLLFALMLPLCSCNLFVTPITFETTKAEREQVVVERLKDIRTAQRLYHNQYGHYTSSFNDLLAFTETTDVFANKGADFDLTSIKIIPFSDKATGMYKEFDLDTASIKTQNGYVNVFEAFAKYTSFLGDLDKQELIKFRDEQINILGRADGLKVGSLTEVSNDSGN